MGVSSMVVTSEFFLHDKNVVTTKEIIIHLYMAKKLRIQLRLLFPAKEFPLKNYHLNSARIGNSRKWANMLHGVYKKLKEG